MVDVASKNVTQRVAIASGDIFINAHAQEILANDTNKKGSVTHTAIIASIMGAKKTQDIIPLCHGLNLDEVSCDIENIEGGLRFTATVSTNAKTGVEMEALTAVSIGLLTIYDMLKAVDKQMRIENIHLVKKTGGKTDYVSNQTR